MKCILSVVALAGLVSVAPAAEDRTTSGLTNLINPGAQGPYPAPPAPYAGAQGPYPAPPAPYPAPAPPPESWDTEPQQQAFTVQSGYEGFLLPSGPAPEPHSALLPLGGLALGASLLKHFLPFPFNTIAVFLTTKVGLWVAGFFLLTLVGSAATTALCAFTPLCTISFFGLGKVNRESTRSLLSQENLNSLTTIVHDAINTYKRLQTRVGKAVKGKKLKEAKEQKEITVAESRPKEAKEENISANKLEERKVVKEKEIGEK